MKINRKCVCAILNAVNDNIANKKGFFIDYDDTENPLNKKYGADIVDYYIRKCDKNYFFYKEVIYADGRIHIEDCRKRGIAI